MAQLFRQIFFNNYSVWALLFLTIQQAIVASSTFFIVRLNDAVIGQQRGEALILLGLFFGSLTVVYIPAIGYKICVTKAENISFRYYIESITKRLFNQPFIEGNKQLKERYSAWIIAESERVISQLYNFFFDTLALVLNISCNILAIVMIHKQFFMAYCVSIVVTFLSHGLFHKLISRVTNTKLAAWQRYRNTLSRALKNIVLGNLSHQQGWYASYLNAWKYLNDRLVKSEWTTHCASMQGIALSITPIIVVTFLLFCKTHTWYLLSGIVVTLPRQVQIIQNIYELSSCLSKAPIMQTSLKALFSSFELPVNDLHRLINWEKIAINGVAENTYPEVLKMADTPNRYRITGENGAGKTSLLLQLKTDLGQKAIYIPANPEDLEPCTPGSTGQIMKEQLQQTLESSCQCILLDEWNASLDNRTTQIINNKVTNIAKSKAVFEVIHRA